MSLQLTNFLTSSNVEKRQEREEAKRLEKERNQYNPREHVRELNPYWKDGGDGLPSALKFHKPTDNESRNERRQDYKKYYDKRPNSSSNWRKKPKNTEEDERLPIKNSQGYVYENISEPKKLYSNENKQAESTTVSPQIDDSTSSNILSDKELNALAAKLVKAEIMGNTSLVDELKAKLEIAKNARNAAPEQAKAKDEEVILTRTDSKGYSRPVKLQSDYSEPSGSKKRKQKVETHKDGERVRYFADDDKYSLKQMFENEKFSSVEDQNSQFMKLAGKIRKNDDLDDVFADKIRRTDSDEKIDRKNKDKAISEHQRMTQSLDSCNRCLQSDGMTKHLMVSMGETMYLCLPSSEPITDGHCLIIPIRHTPCGTQLDENEWVDLMDFRRSLVKMFAAKDEDVIFFETSRGLHRFPHMILECVPVPKEQGDLAPIYFKKAIDESETEWSNNKKLVSLAGKDVRKCIPKGLPYFAVSFGMQEGYAHVIEDEQYFPNNFAQEIIGGMLDLHHSKWRKPRRQNFEEQSNRVLQFSKIWKDFDHTTTT